MDKRILGTAIVLGAILSWGAAPAWAGTAAVAAQPGAVGAEVDYVPDQPEDPTLSGRVSVSCRDGAPWIVYSLTLTDPDDVATSHLAELVLTRGSNSVTVPLGTITGGALTGSVLWPGASVDANGVGNGWPGFTTVGGEVVETTGNFAWTRGPISAEVRVNPTLPVALSYPAANSACLTATGLPATGGTPVVAGTIALAGAAALATGVVVLLRRRHGRA